MNPPKAPAELPRKSPILSSDILLLAKRTSIEKAVGIKNATQNACTLNCRDASCPTTPAYTSDAIRSTKKGIFRGGIRSPSRK